MKRKGDCSYFTADRNAALVKDFFALVRGSRLLDMAGIFRRLSRVPAPRFFISEERALELLRSRWHTGRWPLRDANRLRMMEEIERRVRAALEEVAECTPSTMEEAGVTPSQLADIVFGVVNSQAPSYYLTPGSCRTIVYSTFASES